MICPACKQQMSILDLNDSNYYCYQPSHDITYAEGFGWKVEVSPWSLKYYSSNNDNCFVQHDYDTHRFYIGKVDFTQCYDTLIKFINLKAFL